MSACYILHITCVYYIIIIYIDYVMDATMNNLMKKPSNLSPPLTRGLELEEVLDRGRYNS